VQIGKASLYHKVWEVKEKNGMKKLTLGDSKRNQDGTYENWSWFDCLLVSKAKEVDVEKGDTIKILSGQVQKRKYKDKYHDNIVLFDIEIMEKSTTEPEDVGFDEFEIDDDVGNLPF
jgi:hypothetical protein